MAGHDWRVGQHGHQVGGRNRLARLRAERLKVGCEGRGAGQQTLHGHGGDRVGLGEQTSRVVDGQAQHAEDGVGAVGDRQTFLLGQFDWLQTGFGQGLGRRLADPIDHHLPLAQQRQRSMGQGGQISRRAQRPVLGNHWRDPGVQQVDHALGHQRAGAAVAQCEGAGPKQHHGPNHLVLNRLAHASRM